MIHCAKVSLRQRQPLKALQYLNRAYGLDSASAEVAFLKARCLRHTGDIAGFREQILRAAQLAYAREALEREQLLLMAQIGRLREVEPKIPELLQSAGEDTVEVCHAYVAGLLLHYRHEEALIVLDSWIKDYPRDPSPLIIRGQVFRSVGRLAEAESAYRKACELQPESKDHRLQLADLLLLAKKIDEAQAIYQALTNDTDRRDHSWLQLAKCARHLGHGDEAESALEQIRDERKLPPGELEYQRGLCALDRDDFEKALPLIQLANKANPRSIEVQNALVIALHGCGRITESSAAANRLSLAQQALSRSDKLHDQVVAAPLDPQPRLEIGRTLLKYGDAVNGLAWLQSVLSLDPLNFEANSALAEYYESQAGESPHSSRIAAHYRQQAQTARSVRTPTE